MIKFSDKSKQQDSTSTTPPPQPAAAAEEKTGAPDASVKPGEPTIEKTDEPKK